MLEKIFNSSTSFGQVALMFCLPGATTYLSKLVFSGRMTTYLDSCLMGKWALNVTCPARKSTCPGLLDETFFWSSAIRTPNVTPTFMTATILPLTSTVSILILESNRWSAVADSDLQIRGVPRHSDPEIGGGCGLKKIRPFGPQFGLEIRGGRAPWAPPLDLPLKC